MRDSNKTWRKRNNIFHSSQTTERHTACDALPAVVFEDVSVTFKPGSSLPASGQNMATSTRESGVGAGTTGVPGRPGTPVHVQGVETQKGNHAIHNRSVTRSPISTSSTKVTRTQRAEHGVDQSANRSSGKGDGPVTASGVRHTQGN